MKSAETGKTRQASYEVSLNTANYFYNTMVALQQSVYISVSNIAHELAFIHVLSYMRPLHISVSYTKTRVLDFGKKFH